jgi:tetratricopeptide (TPR) repeat protein
VVDDELLQEWLSKATGLYGNGDYRGAIEAWKEALAVDPSSQRAREGIQMATLLLADFDPAATNALAGTPPPMQGQAGASPILPPAPQPRGPAKPEPDPAAVAARLDAGVRRVRELLRKGEYSEAIEGARGLVPIDPDSEEVQRLVEEAEQAFESAPFIDEHLTLSRELLAQDRRDEAEAECRKVFALDPANPDAHALIATIRAGAAAPAAASPVAPAQPQGDLGGRTMRIDQAQLQALHRAAGVVPEKPAPVAASAPEPAEPEPAPAAASADEAYEIDMDAPISAEAVGELEALPDLEAEPALPDIDALPDDLLEEPGPSLETQESSAEPEPEVVDATTVVPASVRLVTRTGDPNDSVERLLQPETEQPPPEGIELTPTLSRDTPPSPAAPKPSGKPPGDVSGGWEQELETLNRKTGEHEIVGRAAARSSSQAAAADADLDLSSLLGDDIGPLQGVADEHEAPADHAAIPLSPAAGADPEPAEPDPVAPVEKPERPAPRPAPRAAASAASVSGGVPSRGGRSLSTWFALAGVVVLAAAAAVWWFFLQPRVAAGRSLPPAAAAPPSGSSGTESRAGAGPIPTPIGSTSRQTTQETAASQSPAPVASKPAPASAPASGTAEPSAPSAQATPKSRTPEEARQEAARQKARGKAAMAAGQWVEARDAFAAVMALDPVDFESKTLLDQVQVKVDEEKKVHGGYDEARKLFDDRDYQGALWKLYRLPQDGRLGNLDIPVRNAWFNWAVVALKGGDATDARQKLQEVLSVDPADADASKMMDVATTYASRPKDKTFYSFVDSLRFRAFDRK